MAKDAEDPIRYRPSPSSGKMRKLIYPILMINNVKSGDALMAEQSDVKLAEEAPMPPPGYRETAMVRDDGQYRYTEG